MSRRGDTTRRGVLQATGGALAVGLAGTTPTAGSETADRGQRDPGAGLAYNRVFAQYDCAGVSPEPIPETLPEIDVRGEQPTATEVPDSSEVVVFAYGYNTPPDAGRRLAATFQRALEENGYTHPVVAVQWRAEPPEDGGFGDSIENADEDGEMLASWLADSFSERTVRLVGYSLGARVALRTVTELDSETLTLASVSLLGPAVPAASVCPDGEFELSATETVHAYHSENDPVICEAYEGYLRIGGDADPPALGCTGPDCETTPETVVGRNVTETIDSHCAYSFREVGVVDQVVADFSGDANGSDDSSEDTPATPSPTDSPTPTETPEPTPTATPATTEPTPEQTESAADGSGPGLGVFSAIAGVLGAGALYARRLAGRE